MVSRTDRIMLGICAGFALAVPTWLLQPGPPAQIPLKARNGAPIAPPPVDALATLYRRPLFAAAGMATDAAPADAPELIGIAGRLNKDAVAMVRTGDGTTRSLRPGDSVDGWRLSSLAIDAAFFTRGREQVRVQVPGGEEPEMPAQ